MSCLGLKSNHLLPTKKVWNKLGSTIRTKLSKLKHSKIVGRAITRLNTTGRSRPSHRSPCDCRRRKNRSLTYLHRHRSSTPVYVDDLYNQPKPVHVEHGERKELTKSAANNTPFRASVGASASASSASFASSTGASTIWEAPLSVVRGMGEVDLRAEMFIRRFREEMRLQRQRSFGEFQDMLARGV